MLLETLSFLAANKTVVLGAVACVGESGVIIYNLVRKVKAENAKRILHDVSQVKAVHAVDFESTSKWQKILWSANPMNLFREP